MFLNCASLCGILKLFHGQIITDKNTPANMVHFKASVNGLEFYLTDSGITYVFVKHNRDLYDAGLGGSPDPNFKPTTEYGRIDMNLKNAVLNKNTVVKEFPTKAQYNYYYAQCSDGVMALSGHHKITYKNVFWLTFKNYFSSKIK